MWLSRAKPDSAAIFPMAFALHTVRRMKSWCAVLLLPLAAAACGGGADGTRVFQRADDGLSHVRTIRAHIVVNTHVPIEQTTTVPASALPLPRLHLARWARHPRRYDCGAQLECARADLDVKAAARELEPVLPPLPFDPGSVDSAKVEITIGRNDGVLRLAHLQGDLLGLQFEVDLKASRDSR
jgi:hypothetical protein